MNVLLTTGTDGSVTVHKDTCKKIAGRETRSVEAQIESDPQKLVVAKKASCCKPSDSILGDVEQAGWDALEEATDEEATDEEAAPDEETVDDLDDLIGGGVETRKLTVKKVAKKVAEKKALDGSEALKKVADYLEIDLGEDPKFPGFGRAFKTAAKQSVYINSKGSADARATDAAQADEWATLDHVERRSGNYVRVSFGNI